MLKTPEIQDRHRFPQSVRACTTAATIWASTGPQIRNRAPVLNSTSITPGDSGNLVSGAASVGTSNVNDANRAAPCNCRAPAKQLARLYSGLASDRRRNCTRLHRGCNDAFLLGSRPSSARPNRSHYLGLRFRHWIAPNIHHLNLSITGASFCMKEAKA